MKTLLRLSLIVSTLLTFASSSFAAALDTPDRAMALQDRLEKSLFAIHGVNGVGIGGCDPKTGKESVNKSFVHCLDIMTETKDAYNYLLKKYPVGTKVDGVFISIQHIGVIRPQPRATAGN